MAEIAAECGVKRIVNVASANVFAYGTEERPDDKTKPIAYPFTESVYARSKFEPLQRLERFRDRIEIETICPTFMIGTWDSRPSSGQEFRRGGRCRLGYRGGSSARPQR